MVGVPALPRQDGGGTGCWSNIPVILGFHLQQRKIRLVSRGTVNCEVSIFECIHFILYSAKEPIKNIIFRYLNSSFFLIYLCLLVYHSENSDLGSIKLNLTPN